MHRSFAITVPPDATDDLLSELEQIDEVVSLAVHRDASLKPPGDVVHVEALNKGADDVLAAVGNGRHDGTLSVAASTVSSLTDTDHQRAIADDSDAATWEDATTSLRLHAQLTLNYLAIMALGGIVAACALYSSSTTQATALVAAAIIAPGLEPLLKLPLGLVVGRPEVAVRGLRSAVAGYLALVASAALTMVVMDVAGTDLPARFVANRQVGELADPTTVALVVSAAGAVAAAVMVVSHRVTLLAGPLVAMQLIPAAAMVGMALAIGETGLAVEGLARFGVDVGMVVAAGLLVFGLRRLLTHRRAPLV